MLNSDCLPSSRAIAAGIGLLLLTGGVGALMYYTKILCVKNQGESHNPSVASDSVGTYGSQHSNAGFSDPQIYAMVGAAFLVLAAVTLMINAMLNKNKSASGNPMIAVGNKSVNTSANRLVPVV